MLLARSGTKVLAVDRELSLAQRTVAMILAEGGDAAAHATDVTSESECNDMVTAALDHFGRLDYLDNNVGIGSRGSVVDEPAETRSEEHTSELQSLMRSSSAVFCLKKK